MDTTKTWAFGGDIGSIPLDISGESTQAEKEARQSSSKPRGTRTRRQSEKCERMRVSSQPWTAEATQHHHQLRSICRLLPRYGR
jgi:transglutaminase/protease-like cytokinesis protein 3